MQEPPPLPISAITGSSNLSTEQPWPGLAPFTINDTAFFHGREIETLELFRLVKRGTLTLLFAKSGLGKSSLLNAGLFPLLQDSGLAPLYVRLDHSENARPLADQVQAAVTPLLQQPMEATLWECFHRRERPDDPESRPLPVVVLDQFEEIFTLGRETVAQRQRSAEFFSQLADLIQNNCPAQAQERFDRDRNEVRNYDFDRERFKVVISMREEYLAFLEESRQPLRHLITQRLRVVEMSGSQALEAIVEAGGHLPDEGVGESIVRFVAGADSQADVQTAPLDDIEVAPALLSLVCSELNDTRRQRGLGTISAQLLFGSREQILSGFYERCFLGTDPGLRVFLEDQLLTTSGYRDSMAVEDAVRLKDVSAAALQTLVERRLLRIDRMGGTARIEITHDILIGPCRRSRDLRHLRDQRLWSKLLIVASHTEKFAAAAVGLPLLLFILASCVGYWVDNSATSTGSDNFAWALFLTLFSLASAVWLIAVFVKQRRWTWVVRLLIQLLHFACGVLFGVSALIEAANLSLKLTYIIISCYLLILPSVFSLLHLIATAGATFARRRKALPCVTITNRAAQ